MYKFTWTMTIMLNAVACCSQAWAHQPAVLEVMADQHIRNIDPQFFGGGTEFFNRYFDLAMKHPQSRKLIAESHGFLRFPHGTACQHYFWDNPKNSYNPRKNPLFMTTEYIVDICRDLNLQPVFQVNTYQYPGRGNKSFESSKVLVAPGNISEAAQYAAKWVKYCRDMNYNIRWWEIGNEDWIYWTGHQYGALANKFARAMKKADPTIRILLQGKTDIWNGGFQRSYGPVWMNELLQSVDRDLFDAVSVHFYLNGQIPDAVDRSLEDEVSTMFARIDLARREQFLANFIRENDLQWETWITEFNFVQRDEKGPGKLRLMQNVAHGLVIADWIGRMLEIGFDRLALHDMTGHPCFQHIDVGKWTTPDKPQSTVVGLAIAAFTQQFGQDMLNVQWKNNPARLRARLGEAKYHEQPQETHEYPSLSAYAALRPQDNTLRIVLINRDVISPADVLLDLGGFDIAPGTTANINQLGGDAALDASNIRQADNVQWLSTMHPLDDNTPIKLKAHSVTVVAIPLAPTR